MTDEERRAAERRAALRLHVEEAERQRLEDLEQQKFNRFVHQSHVRGWSKLLDKTHHMFDLPLFVFMLALQTFFWVWYIKRIELIHALIKTFVPGEHDDENCPVEKLLEERRAAQRVMWRNWKATLVQWWRR